MTNTNVEARKTENMRPAEETRNSPVFSPDTDIFETQDAIVVVADMPGVDDKHVDIQLENDVLTLTGRVSREAPKDMSLLYRGYSEGDYQRSFTLSEDIEREGIKARIKDGVLRITLPKARKNLPREIPVENG